MKKPRLLWIGDAGCQSGFAKATHGTLCGPILNEFDVTVLGLNYRGDPHSFPYPIYAAAVTGDVFGVNRLLAMMDLVRPDVVVIQNDPWNIPAYIERLRLGHAKMKRAGLPDLEYLQVPIVAIVAVDGLNFCGENLDGVSHAIFWTEFGRREAAAGGYAGEASVIPLGVDTITYRKLDKAESRRSLGLPKELDNAFIIGNVNRNQDRKRLDLTISYVASWLRMYPNRDAWLYLHVAPTGDANGCDPAQFAEYCGLRRTIFRQPEPWYGDSEEKMARTFNAFDVQLSTSQNEGFSLSTFEGLACEVPQIVPSHSAFEDLLDPQSSILIPCSGPRPITSGGQNVLGGTPDLDATIEALQTLYEDPARRARMGNAGRQFALASRFDWTTISQSVCDVLLSTLASTVQEAGATCG